MFFLYILIFIVSIILIYLSGKWLVDSVLRIAKFLGWREFVIAFFIMAFLSSVNNLFVGISSALHKIPQLSFGDVVGGNIVDLTLVIALAVLIAGKLPAKSRMVQGSAIFTMLIALLPLLLVLDKALSRADGIILILTFFLYIFWLFSKAERFRKVYDGKRGPIVKEFKIFVKAVGRLILGISILILSAEGIVRSAFFFAQSLNLPIALIGILIIGLGNALPETYFAIVSAKKRQTWMILGDLMGSVIIPATLVLGIVALIEPIKIDDFSPFAIARIFLIISALFFLFFSRSDKKITKKEAYYLLAIYVIFVIVEILTK